MLKTININKRARFDYEIIEKFTAGIVLAGTEIKSIRLGKANITESFCEFSNNELFAINTYIEEYALVISSTTKSKRTKVT
jgi:SsrA-binding protein